MKPRKHDYLMKLLLIGDSGVGKSSALIQWTDHSFSGSFITTIGIDFKIKTIEIGGHIVKIQVWDTAGQERFRTITTAYYRGAMGIMLLYNITDESSFQNIHNWMRNIEQHASDSVEILICGNKYDLVEESSQARAVSFESLQAVGEKYEVPVLEVSAKSGFHINDAFVTLAERILVQLKNRVQKAHSISVAPKEYQTNYTIDCSCITHCFYGHGVRPIVQSNDVSDDYVALNDGEENKESAQSDEGNIVPEERPMIIETLFGSTRTRVIRAFSPLVFLQFLLMGAFLPLTLIIQQVFLPLTLVTLNTRSDPHRLSPLFEKAMFTDFVGWMVLKFEQAGNELISNDLFSGTYLETNIDNYVLFWDISGLSLPFYSIQICKSSDHFRLLHHWSFIFYCLHCKNISFIAFCRLFAGIMFYCGWRLCTGFYLHKSFHKPVNQLTQEDEEKGQIIIHQCYCSTCFRRRIFHRRSDFLSRYKFIATSSCCYGFQMLLF